MTRSISHGLRAALACALAWALLSGPVAAQTRTPLIIGDQGETRAPKVGESIDASAMSATALGGSVARTEASRAVDGFTPKDLGAKGDGATNDVNAIKAALVTRGGSIFVPAGTYNVTLASGQVLGAIPAGTHIRGAGRDVTKIIIQASDTAYLNVFNLANSGVAFSDVTLDFRLVNGGSGSLFLFSGGSKITFERTRLLGNIGVTQTTPGDLTTGVAASTPYLFNIGGDGSDVAVRDSEIAGWTYTILKANASTATNRRWTFTGNHFYGNAYGHIAPNSPSGIWDGLTIAGNTFGDTAVLSGSAGLSHMVGLASIWNTTITGNRFVGVTSGEAIHIEENTRNVVVTGNTADMSSPYAGWGKFVQITDNNVSGTRYTPSDISITGNTARRADGKLDGVGIDAPYDGSGQAGVQGLVVDGNIIDGFATGVSLPELSYGSRVTNNTVRNFTTGISAFSGSSDVRENSFESGTTGLVASRGGLFGRQRFAGVATLATSSGGVVGLRGWSRHFETASAGAAAIPLSLGVIGKRFSGTFRVLVSAGSTTDAEVTDYAASWDGSAITQTKGWTYSGGGAVVIGNTPLSVDAGSPFNLKISPFVNGARPFVGVTVDFDGTQVF